MQISLIDQLLNQHDLFYYIWSFIHQIVIHHQAHKRRFLVHVSFVPKIYWFSGVQMAQIKISWVLWNRKFDWSEFWNGIKIADNNFIARNFEFLLFAKPHACTFIMNPLVAIEMQISMMKMLKMHSLIERPAPHIKYYFLVFKCGVYLKNFQFIHFENKISSTSFATWLFCTE